ncbi:MAG: PAS domain S-box protein [Ignavibacteriales bacterium]|nr:PAS domain S-box protein [Ignavibacteriales bacterium]
MKLFRNIKKFRAALGPVEQAQVVASTAVVVALITILAVRITSAPKITVDFLLFGSVLTVGIFGFLIVVFTLKYGRLLEDQKQELIALNTVSEAVNRAVDISYLLQSVLVEIKRLLDIEYAWIYRYDGMKLILSAQKGTEELEFSMIDLEQSLHDPGMQWVRSPKIQKRPPRSRIVTWEFGDIDSWVSVPILMKDNFFGLIILASKSREAFAHKQLDLINAFANQIGVAMENTALIDRLKKSEERYMDLFEHSPDMYHIVNREGIVVSCNMTEADRLGYRKEDLVGQHVSRLYPEAYHEEVQRLLKEIFDTGREVKGLEEHMMTSSGQLIDVSVNTSIIYDETKKPVLMRAVARDITEKKRLEEKILHAQRIDSIGNLAGGVAHDFNNILTSILGSTAIMKRKMKPQEHWYRLIDIIDTAAKRGASLTRQLLTFARKGNVQFRPMIVNDIIEETLNLFERSVDKTIEVKKTITVDLCLINGDEGQIQQALLNILINARDSMPDGGVIAVQAEKINFSEHPPTAFAEARVGEYVAVSVADSGLGMPKDVQNRIFEPFFTTKDQGKGTGLGLSVVYGVINSHNGFVTVQSEPGVGSQFTLYFPLLEESETLRRSLREPKLLLGKESVLVVDDEKDVGEIIGGMLSQLGYKVTIVDSGRKALALYKKKKRFDVVVLDMNMPSMGGKETFLKLKGIDPNANVLISTGYSDQSIESSHISHAVDGFLQKPYQLEELSKTMRELLEKKRNYQS